MRYLLLLAVGAALGFAGASPASADDAKPVNTVCPVSGKPVDPSVPPVTATDKDGKTVAICACCSHCAAKIAKDPAKYVAAAEANTKQ